MDARSELINELDTMIENLNSIKQKVLTYQMFEPDEEWHTTCVCSTNITDRLYREYQLQLKNMK